MKINTISFKNFRVNYFPNFKQKENDEYVDNPQDFGKEDADSFEKSAEKNENNKDKENKKSKYNMWQNTGFMLKTAWEICRSVPFLVVILAAVTAGKTTAEMLIAPVLLGQV